MPRKLLAAVLMVMCAGFIHPAVSAGGTEVTPNYAEHNSGTPDPFSLNLSREAGIAAAGVSLVGAGRYVTVRTHAPDPAGLSRNDVPGIDRIALELHSRRADTMSDYSVTVCSILALLVAASPLVARGNGLYRETAENLAMYAETVLLEKGLTELVKGSARRSRPYAYDESKPLDVRRERNAALSFWSGHTASAFACAVFAGYVYQERNPRSDYRVPVWIGGMSAATVTAFMRVRAGTHFPTDVIAGAAAGSFTGWLVPRLHRTKVGGGAVVSVVCGEPGLEINVAF